MMNFLRIITRRLSLAAQILFKGNDIEFATSCYAQEGEDKVLNEFLCDIKQGFYVDIGAHHPFRFSNTFLFYKRGWSGINIDATPGAMNLFKKYRPRDINLEMGIGGKNGEGTYYLFHEKALNGFLSKERLDSLTSSGFFPEEQRVLPFYPLGSILEKYVPAGEKISFLSIDVEGMELQILQSNNWEKFSPNFIAAEIFVDSLNDLQNNDLVQFLNQKSYKPVAKTMRTVFFKKLDIGTD